MRLLATCFVLWLALSPAAWHTLTPPPPPHPNPLRPHPTLCSCGLRTDGAAQCWPSIDGRTTVPGGLSSKWASISTGMANNNCGIFVNGSMACWGADGLPASLFAVPGGLASTWSQVSVGYDHVVALAPNGTIYCWRVAAWGGVGWGGGAGRGRGVPLGRAR